jgi:hypothetical protein
MVHCPSDPAATRSAAAPRSAPARAPGSATLLTGLMLVSSGMAPATMALTIGLATTPASAQLAIAPEQPAFTPYDQSIIARNSLLRDAVASDPWLVRRTLDGLYKGMPESRSALPTPAPSARDMSLAPPRLDPSSNPDLVPLDRASPEAANDLFQLLKKVGAGSPTTPAK